MTDDDSGSKEESFASESDTDTEERDEASKNSTSAKKNDWVIAEYQSKKSVSISLARLWTLLMMVQCQICPCLRYRWDVRMAQERRRGYCGRACRCADSERTNV